MQPVSVICLCYNQSQFVEEAITSVMQQTYPGIQLIVVDDASTDNSVSVIEECRKKYPQILFFPLKENVGNCRAFNFGLTQAVGEYIIDLAADDVLLPHRVSKGVEALSESGPDYGVHFTDADWIDRDGALLYRHSDRFPHNTIPQGDVYKHLIERFFICSPSMMYRGEVIRALGGYDETLAYEDFDFWIRSSRRYRYCYTPEVLVKKRVVTHSMSHKQFSLRSPQLESTYRVCEKILSLNRTADEQRALAKRIRYEISVCVRLFAFGLVVKYMRLYLRNARITNRYQ
ncbi:MAG TPA: glycosyltransferase [Chryseosolibacter sp.]|nr:glycosyltransferase [Chryseosolibacter sp.]